MLLRSWRLAFSLVVVALMGVMIARPAAAQEDEADEFDLNDLEGLEQAVGRSYTADMQAFIDSMSTPGADMELPEGPLYVYAVVAKFDDDGHAEDGLNKLADEVEASPEDLTDGDFQEADLGDVGDNRRGYMGTTEESGMTTTGLIALVQKDEYVYFVVVQSTGGDGVDATKDLIEQMIDNDEGDDVETDDAGLNSGGLWDKYPDNDDDVLGGLQWVGDDQLFPEEETPDA